MFRNIAIIAHVDLGKTTSSTACCVSARRSPSTSRSTTNMDSMDLERERGITIASKNTAVFYKGMKINIINTPGHADFGGEVERAVDGRGAMFVDASEVLFPRRASCWQGDGGRSVDHGLHQQDRPPDARIEEFDEIYDLFIDLDASESQLEFPVPTPAPDGVAHYELGDDHTDLTPLLDSIIKHVPDPRPSPLPRRPQFLVANLDYDPYVGRLSIVLFGAPIKRNEQVMHYGAERQRNVRAQLLYTWRGLRRVEVTEATPGDIIAVAVSKTSRWATPSPVARSPRHSSASRSTSPPSA